MIVKLLTEHHLEFLSLKGGCTGSSESTHVKIPHCWKSHVVAQMKDSFDDLTLPTSCIVSSIKGSNSALLYCSMTFNTRGHFLFCWKWRSRKDIEFIR